MREVIMTVSGQWAGDYRDAPRPKAVIRGREVVAFDGTPPGSEALTECQDIEAAWREFAHVS